MVSRSFANFRTIALSMSIGVVLGLLMSIPVHAQIAGATLSGTITDASGAVIPKANLSIRNMATGVVRAVTTDAAGLYTAPSLQPGTYEVTISAPGFDTQVQTGVLLEVGASRVLNGALSVGKVTQNVNVTGQASDVQLASSSISGTVTQQTVVDLPLNGRDWTALATLQPGVSSARGQALADQVGARGAIGMGNAVTASGHRPEQNNYSFNGINVQDFANSAPANPMGEALGVDTVQEFNVTTDNYTAETGRAAGMSINAIERSGGNAFHGDVYEFIRNAVLDARNYFDAPTTIPPYRRNQFGASIGGPIKKDKTFFFFNYEGFRLYQSVSEDVTVPTAAAEAGNLCSVPSDGTCTPSTITVNPLVKPYFTFWPLPNAGLVSGSGGNTGYWKGAGFLTMDENYFSARGDHKISDRDSLVLSWYHDRAPFHQTDSLVTLYNVSNALRDFGSIQEIHIFGPRLVNTARFGLNRLQSWVNHPGAAINPAVANTTLGPGGPGAGTPPPTISVTGISGFSGGLGNTGDNTHTWNSFQFYDDLSFTRGTHALQFGFATERMDDNELPHSVWGNFSFNSLTNFLLNEPADGSFLGPVYEGYGNRQTLFAGYAQDNWRFASRLTLNLGVRYEMTTLPTEAHNRYLAITSPDATGTPVPVHTLWANNQTLRNFAPRVGFAWAPFPDQKTSIRGAFGVYDLLPLSYIWQWTPALGPPFNYSSSVTLNGTTGTFPYAAYQMVSFANISPSTTATWVEPAPKASYALNWNLNVQRSLTSSTTLTVGYVGNHGVHLPNATDDWNFVVPSPVNAGAGWIWPYPAGSGTRLNPLVGPIRANLWVRTSSFNGLDASLTKRMSHGFQVQGSYAWDACFDDGSYGGPQGTSFTNDGVFSELRLHGGHVLRGPCAYNLRQLLTVSYLWQLPTPKLGGQAMAAASAAILGGWQLGGIFSVSTGPPFSLGLSGDPLGMLSPAGYYSDAPNLLRSVPGCKRPWNPGNHVSGYVKVNCFSPPFAPASMASECSNFSGATQPAPSGNVYCANLFGDAGRGQLYGPGLINYDFSTEKNVPVRKISEAFNVQFRAEFFNILNRTNLETPSSVDVFTNTGAPVAGAGNISSTVTAPRQIQFGLKAIF